MPVLDASNSVTVLPGDYASLSAAIDANPGKHIELADADYTAWGNFTINNKTGGTSILNPCVIRYAGAGLASPPWQRTGQAITGSVRVSGTSSHWFISGLTVQDKTVESTIFSGADNITIDRLHDTGTVVVYGIRVRGATNITIQRSLFDAPTGIGTVDQNATIGVAIGNIDADVLGIKVLDTEVRNFSDGVQTLDGPTVRRPVELTIDGCDFTLTPLSHLSDGTAYCENGIDLKAGSDRPFSTIIRNTRIVGFRKNAAGTDTGVGITIHRYARNILIEDVTIGDGPEGIREVGWPVGEDLEEPRNIVMRGVRFHDIRDISGSDTGACLHLISNTEVSRCAFSRCDYLLLSTTAYRAGGPTLYMNVRTETEVLHPDSTETNPYTESAATGNFHRTRDVVFDTYELRQHTGPEFLEGADEVSTGTYAQIRDEQARLIEALTPTSAAAVTFKREEGRVDFRQWAQANPSACFRRFSIIGSMRDEGPLVSNTDFETYRTDTIVTVAYPKQMGKYGADNIRDLQDLIEEDRFLIDDTIGHRGQNNQLACQNYCRRTEDPSVDDAGAVWLVTLTFETEYQRSV